LEGRPWLDLDTPGNGWVSGNVNSVEASPVMVVAAFVLSVVAVLVAGVSAWYARQQSVSAEGARRIEAARRHDELRPSLAGEYVTARKTRDGDRPGVKFTNQGPIDLDHVDVMAVPAHRADEAVIEGIYNPPGRDYPRP
jgi:DNA-binding transcriptional regulator YdaS (Cro superfamily)